MLICPESPTWLVLKGRRREATEVAQKLWGEEAAATQLGAGALAWRGLIASVACRREWPAAAAPAAAPAAHWHACAARQLASRRSRHPLRNLPAWHAGKEDEGGAEPSWGEVLRSRAARTGVALFLFQQFSGINAIVYFSSAGEAGGSGGSLAQRSAGAALAWPLPQAALAPPPTPWPQCLPRPASSRARWRRPRWAPQTCWAPWWRQA